MKYLLYIRYSLSGLSVYEAETEDIFHVIGKAHYCAPEQITWFQFVKDEQFRRDFWKDHGHTIKKVPDKWLN